MPYCPNCKKYFKDELEFCPFCKTVAPECNICPECGTKSYKRVYYSRCKKIEG